MSFLKASKLLPSESLEKIIGCIVVTMWFTTAVKEHNATVKAGQRAFVDCFKVYCIGRVFVTEQHGVTLVFANIYNLLNLFRSIGSGYIVTLQGDVTHNA